MPYKNTSARINIVLMLLLFMLTGLVNTTGKYIEVIPTIIVSVSYIMMIVLWHHSLEQRILDKHIASILTGISSTLTIWLILRLIKYEFIEGSSILATYIWYSYYVILLISVTLTTLIAVRIDRGLRVERDRLRWMWLPSGLLMLMVMTNSIHHAIFSFPATELRPDVTHSYGFGYYIIMWYIMGLFMASIIIIMIKCQNRASRRLLFVPIIAFTIGVVLCIFVDRISMYEMPEAFSFTLIITLESCIQIGLIPTNMGYADFFYEARIPAIITNSSGEVQFRTESSQGVDFHSPGDNQEIKSSEVQSGHAVWLEDYSDIAVLNQRLSEIKEQLSEENSLLQAENAMTERRLRTMSKTRIYEDLSEFIQPILTRISKELDAYRIEGNDLHLATACIYTSYVKRRSNLMLMSSEGNRIHADELTSSIRESVDSIRLRGIDASSYGRLPGMADRSALIEAYDVFEEIIEGFLDSMSQLLVSIAVKDQRYLISVMMEGDIKGAMADSITGCQHYEEDGTHYFTISLRRDGGNNV